VRLAPRGAGHPLAVLTVSYPGGRTRQISLRRAQVPEVRRWLANYQQLKEGIEGGSSRCPRLVNM
jgi:hypothetical protein